MAGGRKCNIRAFVLDKIADIKGEYSQDELIREITSQKQEGSSAAQD